MDDFSVGDSCSGGTVFFGNRLYTFIMKRVLYTAMVLLVFASIHVAAADEAELPFSRFTHALGFSAGEILGPGISWLSWTGENGIQVCGGVLYYPPDAGDWVSEIGDDRTLDYSAGAEVMHRIFADGYASWFAGQLYLWAALKHGGYIPVEWAEDEATGDVDYRIGEYIAAVGMGTGIGIELVLFNHLSAPFEFGYMAEAEFLGSDATPLTVQLVFQGGFRYRY